MQFGQSVAVTPERQIAVDFGDEGAAAARNEAVGRCALAG